LNYKKPWNKYILWTQNFGSNYFYDFVYFVRLRAKHACLFKKFSETIFNVVKKLFIDVFCFVFSCNSTDRSTHSGYSDQGSINLGNCPYPCPSTDDFAFIIVRTRICDQRASRETSLWPRFPTNFASSLRKCCPFFLIWRLNYFYMQTKILLALLILNFDRPSTSATRAYTTVRLPAKESYLSCSIQRLLLLKYFPSYKS